MSAGAAWSRRWHSRIWLLVGAILIVPWRPSAHEVPSELTVEAFLRPADRHAVLLLRVPLSGLLAAGLPKEGVGYLALGRIQRPLEHTALALAASIDVYAGETRLEAPRLVAVRISLPFDPSFRSYEAARAHLSSPPLPVDTQVYWTQGFLDAWFEYPAAPAGSDVSIRLRLNDLAPRVTTVLGAYGSDGSFHAFQFAGDARRVRIEPRWYHVLPSFVWQGMRYAIGRLDLWLLAVCLTLASGRPGPLLKGVVFAAAGVLAATLATTYGPDSSGVWLPAVVDFAAVALMVGLLVENIVRRRPRDRALAVLIVGGVGGVAGSLAMRPLLQFSGRHLLGALLSFDAGMTLAFSASVAMVWGARSLLGRALPAPRGRAVVLSALAGNVAWNVMMARARELPVQQWPRLTPAAVVTATSWLLLVALILTGVWLLSGMKRPSRAARRVDGGESLLA